MAHSFSIVGLDPNDEKPVPKLLDYYPDIKEKPQEYMYIHSLSSICSWDGLKEKTIQYTITEASGDQKYLSAFVYGDSKAMILVSEYPMFNT